MRSRSASHRLAAGSRWVCGALLAVALSAGPGCRQRTHSAEDLLVRPPTPSADAVAPGASGGLEAASGNVFAFLMGEFPEPAFVSRDPFEPAPARPRAMTATTRPANSRWTQGAGTSATGRGPKSAGPKSTRRLREPRLRGIIDVEGSRVAVFERGHATEKQTIDGWTVIEIAPGSVTVSRGGETLTLRL